MNRVRKQWSRADPYGGGEPLRYRREGEKYVLWSIGPYGVDNNGRPSVHPKKEGRSRYLIWNDDVRGDYVAGINH